MKLNIQPLSWGEKHLIVLIILGALLSISPVLESKTSNKNGLSQTASEELSDKLIMVEQNSLLSVSSPGQSESKKMKVVITAYSSTVWQTDSTPFVTAAGTEVRDGIIANNLLPFGTRVRIPELYGNKIFVVEDRMNYTKGYYHVDVWFPSYDEALDFGAKRTYIEVLES